MKISSEIDSFATVLGEERTIEYLAKAGFDAWDFSMFKICDVYWGKNYVAPSKHPLSGNEYVEYAKKLKKIGLDNGIVCNQSHAPFPTDYDGIDYYLKRAIELTAIAGGEICVIHPMNSKTIEENKEFYYKLLPFAKEHNVKIATENMWNWDGEKDTALPAACSNTKAFCGLLNAVNDDFLVACLDIGHAEMKGLNTSAEELILSLNDNLKALHIHDNDKWHDSHQIPFSMDIDFTKVAKALKKIDYKGYLTMEACNYYKDFDEKNMFDAMVNLKNSVRKIEELMNK